MSKQASAFCVFALLFSLGCATQKFSGDTSRRLAALDNNGEVVDDSFDPNLETYFGGSAEDERKANLEVAEVIRQSVVAQYEARKEMMASADRESPQAKRIAKDLPTATYATRDVHRKTNGCYKAELKIAADLKNRVNKQIENYKAMGGADHLSTVNSEEDLGVFGGMPAYDAIVRLSNGNPGNNPDSKYDARGFAVKILPKGTLGASPIARMNASDLNRRSALDILTINFPTFFMNDPVRYAHLNKTALSSALDFKNKVVAQTQEFWSVFVSGDLTSLERRLALYVNGSVIYSPLYQEYFSMVPSRLGPEGAIRAVKYSWSPVACDAGKNASFEEESKKQWADWTKDHSYALPPRVPSVIRDPKGLYTKSDFADPNFLRVHTIERLAKDDMCFDLYFQLYRDQKSTDIEDSTDIWLRTDTERAWWLTSVVPNKVVWRASPYNKEDHDSYITRLQEKRLAPAIVAARLTLHKLDEQDASDSFGNNKTCEDLSFNPWNGNIAFHKPLGIVSRMKRKVYNASRRERHGINGIDDSWIERK